MFRKDRCLCSFEIKKLEMCQNWLSFPLNFIEFNFFPSGIEDLPRDLLLNNWEIRRMVNEQAWMSFLALFCVWPPRWAWKWNETLFFYYCLHNSSVPYREKCTNNLINRILHFTHFYHVAIPHFFLLNPIFTQSFQIFSGLKKIILCVIDLKLDGSWI